MENAANILATGLFAAAGAYFAYKLVTRISSALVAGVEHLTRHEHR